MELAQVTSRPSAGVWASQTEPRSVMEDSATTGVPSTGGEVQMIAPTGGRDVAHFVTQEPDRIYAYGFRNAHRLSWDLVDGTMFAADIGGSHIEEINIGRSSAKRNEMQERAGGRHTVPQIFIGDAHVGGCRARRRAADLAARLPALLALLEAVPPGVAAVLAAGRSAGADVAAVCDGDRGHDSGRGE